MEAATMEARKRQLLLAEEGSRNHPEKCLFEASECVEAIDLATRTSVRLRVDQLSTYRHTLYRQGKSFRILNILELAA